MVLSAPLHSIAAADPLTIEFALDVWCDPQFSGVPEAVHLTGEVFGELRCVDHQQGFVVGVSRGGRPVERSSDHFAVVDHRELVMQLVAAGESWCANALHRLLERLIVLFQLAVVIWKGDTQQVKHL